VIITQLNPSESRTCAIESDICKAQVYIIEVHVAMTYRKKLGLEKKKYYSSHEYYITTQKAYDGDDMDHHGEARSTQSYFPDSAASNHTMA
jgi:hypothetical protein